VNPFGHRASTRENLRRPRFRVWRNGSLCSLFSVALAATAAAQSSVDPAAPYAWCENAGWLNAVAGGAGLTVPAGAGGAWGFGWLENAGWLNFGNGTPANPPFYGNTMGEDSGVNHDGAGHLYGLAWGENIGWVNFGTAEQPFATIGGDGQLNGYVWSENIGWINLNSSHGIVLLPGGGGDGFQSADKDHDFEITLSELLRVIQFYNSDGFHCEAGTEDGYAVGPGDQSCPQYSTDYKEFNWRISLSELLRLIQFYNSGGYHYCPLEIPATEDGFCPGL
jgi:hypothetical protein